MSDFIGRIAVPTVINSGETFPLTTQHPFGFSVEGPRDRASLRLARRQAGAAVLRRHWPAEVPVQASMWGRLPTCAAVGYRRSDRPIANRPQLTKLPHKVGSAARWRAGTVVGRAARHVRAVVAGGGRWNGRGRDRRRPGGSHPRHRRGDAVPVPGNSEQPEAVSRRCACFNTTSMAITP